MSMRDYGVDDYGLVLNEKDLQVIASKVCDDYSDEDWELDKWSFVDAIVDKIDAKCIYDFSGGAFAITDAGADAWDSDIYNEDSICFIPVQKYPSFFDKAYNNMEELVLEFKEKMGTYLPENFDYRNHIRHIFGTYFG